MTNPLYVQYSAIKISAAIINQLSIRKTELCKQIYDLFPSSSSLSKIFFNKQNEYIDTL